MWYCRQLHQTAMSGPAVRIPQAVVMPLEKRKRKYLLTSDKGVAPIQTFEVTGLLNSTPTHRLGKLKCHEVQEFVPQRKHDTTVAKISWLRHEYRR